jgi:hypothetical protein
MWMPNGDPGYPDEGGDFEIETIIVGGVDIFELMDAHLENIAEQIINDQKNYYDEI